LAGRRKDDHAQCHDKSMGHVVSPSAPRRSPSAGRE
jgi:hypothetical protein